jgi:feruloyl esterase
MRRIQRCLLIAIGIAAPLAADAAVDCAGLAGAKIDATTITSASAVSGSASIGGASVNAPFCRVEGVARPSADSEIKFEVWLPAAPGRWTGRLKVNGTGGFSGGVPYARLAQDVGDGFISAGSNMGHDGGESPSWTVGRPEKVKDWGLRAHYSVATAAKALGAAFYDAPVKHSYFEGCSNGGRQAMMMAQNYPELFDGIVAGAPSMFYPDLLFWLLWTGKQQIPVAGGPPVLTDAKRAQVTQRVLAACDSLDGLADGQITNPRACRFDVDTLGPAGDKTLTAAELAVVKSMYGGTRTDAGVQRSPGAKLGSEADWVPLFADNGGYGAFIEHYVYSRNTPSFDWRRQLDFRGVYDEAKNALTPVTAAPSPDISAFVRARREADPLPRLERRRRAARRLDRLPLRARAVRDAPRPFARRVRSRGRRARAGRRRGDRRSQLRQGAAVPPAVHAADDGPLHAGQQRPHGHRRRRARAAGEPARQRPSRRERDDQVGRAGRRSGTHHRDEDGRRRQGGAPAPGVRLSGRGEVQGLWQRRRRGQLHVRHAAAADRVMTATDLMVVQSSLRQRNLKLPNR